MDSNTGSTIKTIKFYAEHGFFKDWYADIPAYIEEGGEKGDLQMVAGADVLLDMLSNDEDDITIRFSTTPFEGAEQLDRQDDLGPDFECVTGAYYWVDTIGGVFYGENIWLCDVLKWVFGEHPLTIYYKPV